jgi:hypothetical protein
LNWVRTSWQIPAYAITFSPPKRSDSPRLRYTR